MAKQKGLEETITDVLKEHRRKAIAEDLPTYWTRWFLARRLTGRWDSISFGYKLLVDATWRALGHKPPNHFEDCFFKTRAQATKFATKLFELAELDDTDIGDVYLLPPRPEELFAFDTPTRLPEKFIPKVTPIGLARNK